MANKNIVYSTRVIPALERDDTDEKRLKDAIFKQTSIDGKIDLTKEIKLVGKFFLHDFIDTDKKLLLNVEEADLIPTPKMELDPKFNSQGGLLIGPPNNVSYVGLKKIRLKIEKQYEDEDEFYD